MCGIVGVVGNSKATEILLTGLEKLEYRGYDSAGIFVTNEAKEAHLTKSKGRIADLRAKISSKVEGTTGIGHTRWATHGVPSETNAHPHTAGEGRFVLVHNGVIENFEEIKAEYLTGVALVGETDTEIAVQLINHLATTKKLKAKAAFKEALNIIKGSYAFALVDQEEPDVVYVAKNKSPLLIGLGEGFNVICSDAMAMISETKQFVEIVDGEIVIVKADGITIENAQGETIEREAYEAQIDVADMEKGTYEHYMLKEVDEQPAVMRRLVKEYTNEQGELVVDSTITERLNMSDRVYIVACGTSWHAGWVGKQLIEQLAGVPVEVHVASEFAYNMPLISEKPFFIFISQSGETADSRQVLVKVNELGYDSMTMTNVAGSTLSREAIHTMLLHAGPEIAVASTKAYTAQIATLAILAKAAGMASAKVEAEQFDLVHELGLVAAGMERLVGEKDMISSLVKEKLSETRNAFYIGRGLDYFVSMEAALKLKEISYIQAEGFAAGELKHGTIALIEEGTPVIGVITEEETGAHTRGNLKEVESRGASTLVVSMEGLEREGDGIVLPKVHSLLTPLVSVVPIQLIAYYASLQRGLDVDKPRNLAKSVTVE
ncbi:glutamine--fructose-6-phosphate transaminase (isomerizing) [Vagococcus intermedius]|uniref:Glutamine--fructose-6-phosphate aminotransferase [isomerizing] n=1 Tax=Vagococcus intermedius TaxID=2991418 RepID=A0AAF0CTR7_9ENTE|nr:glutamine--fructose-6-phosphate transaminase (isomerizing) [Vagococcus intermedius]WEG72798.1 glutamine--fructose-6-phosphate transaminase (isomerizing) [Vagococcus intermedius]WEG74883.1 glutamine--fructose-6-phosphate transaminase (isomerizing) [Vagococcus intermedius]